MKLNLSKYLDHLDQMETIPVYGKVMEVIGLTVESSGPKSKIGDLCLIFPDLTVEPVKAEVVGFKNGRVLLMPLGELGSIGPGCEVVNTNRPLSVVVGEELLGRVLDGNGQYIDEGPTFRNGTVYPTNNRPPNPLLRKRIEEPLSVGVKAIDGLITVGKGQRVGIFAGSGVGKSTLMGMIARNTSADVNVIALIGERGREVRDFLERDLGPEGLKRSVVIVATSDQPALLRIKGALIATSIAEYFRDQGMDVMLMMDSVTRYCMAMREVGLAIGEPPTTKGYTPSVFAQLPKLLERAGTSKSGSITAFYTVLVDSDDMNEPIADATRGILDGHIVLSRALAHKNHFPAIDVLSSVSRVMNEITSEEHRDTADQVKRLMATYRDAEDLINIGAYQRGTNKSIDRSIAYIEAINQFVQQKTDEAISLNESISMLIQQFKELK